MSRQFELERMERMLQDLQDLRCPITVPVIRYRMKEGKEPDGAVCDCGGWTDFRIDTPWKELDAHRWLRTTVEIPPEMDGRHVEFQMISGREGQWDATNPQILFYLDGRLLQGVDVNHREVTISRCAHAGEIHEVAMLLYSGTVPGDLIFHSNLIVIDDVVETLCYDLMIPLQSARLIRETDEENCRRILQKLEPAANALDLRKPYTARFYESVAEAEKILRREFYTTVDDTAPVVSAVGHTHIDIAWLWTVAQTREKALRSFSTVLQLMDQYPNYHFMSSQPILYSFVKEQAPELYERIRQRIREGRWEADGAMWLEADCNLTGGESLVRQIMKGEHFFRTEFGVKSRSLWLPDAFGYSAALPQILRKCGIPYFMTTKISWNQYNQLPNDTFLWRGLDGSEVFVFMPTACDFDKTQGAGISFSERRHTTTYTGVINPNMTLGTFKRFQNRDLTEDTIMLFGFGDGGGGPTKEMLESAERLRYGIPGIPRIRLEGEKAFFDRTYGQIAHLPQMPLWDGELYFEYHRGTLSSMGKNKRNNRRSEILYTQLETLASMLSAAAPYPSDVIRRGWDVILLNQFHDIIPGTCIEPVYEQTDREYAEILKNGRSTIQEIATAGAAKLQTPDHAVVIFNTLGYDRSDVYAVDAPEQICGVCEPDGTPLSFQRCSDGRIRFYAEKVPALGHRVFRLIPGEETEEESFWDGSFENGFYRVRFNEKMEILSLIERQTGKEFIREGGVGNALRTYEDRPMNWDNWDIDAYYQKKPYDADSFSEIRILEDGSIRKTLQITKTFSDSVVTQKIHLYHHLPRIDFETHAEWRDHHVLLRVNFPVNVNTKKAAFEVQFGNVERETTCNQSWDSAKFESCGHKWADLSEDNNGISLLNDCKYGYGIKNGNLSLTLIKSGTHPNPNADIGSHDFTYSIYPHPDRWQQARTVEQAYNLNVPPVVVRQEACDGAAGGESFLRCDAENCFIEVLKKAEDGCGTIVRMYENRNRFTRTTLHFAVPVAHLFECNLLEEENREIPTDGHSAETVFHPFEIKTFRIV